MSGVSSDFRDLDAAATEGNELAKNAIDGFVYRVAKYVGAYAAAMNGVDAIAFTAGVGENDKKVRKAICEHFGFLGVKIDDAKNAIRGEEWPENADSLGMSLEDARYSVIRYLASPIANAYGPHVSDPRSGEIIESHIGWYHNVMQLIHDWYLIQAGAVDDATHKMQFDEELMGQLIRFVSSHEVGHTLGSWSIGDTHRRIRA